MIRAVRALLVVAAIVVAFLVAGLADLLVFLALIFLFVALHELAHFATAKWSHMKVTEYFIGFGPRLWSFRWGETDYGIKPIPAGAYVKILGMNNLEEVDPADEPHAYRQQPFHRRVIVASAGSVMHYAIAFALAWIAVVSFGVPSANTPEVTGFSSWPGHAQTAAQAAGLKSGDKIVAVDGHAITTTTQLPADIQAAKGKPVTLTFERHGHRRTATATPQVAHITAGTKEVLGPGKNGTKEWLLGVQILPVTVFTGEGPLRAVGTAGVDVGRVTSTTVGGLVHAFSASGLGSLFNQVSSPQVAQHAASHPQSSNRVMSLIGAARVATQAEQQGMLYLIEILIALNIVFGLLNMLPMLPLDGGHVVIALYERVRTRRGQPYYQADARKLLPVAYAFMAVLLVIVGSAVFLDIAHPIANPFH
ncbi:MAG: M50 family metallopeptidase [Acidimicrobiales bacterium]